MTLQTYLAQIEACERALKQDAKSMSEEDYRKLVVRHLHLIAAWKETRSRRGKPRPASSASMLA